MKNQKQILNRSRFCEGIHLRESGTETPSRTIEGRAIVFNSLSSPLYEDEDLCIREIISPEAVTQELLDNSDIKMTMFHDRQLILGRSRKGSGTLGYELVKDEGVDFSLDVAKTVDGDKALELVSRGDIAGCSFQYSTYYYDEDYVSRSEIISNGKREITYIVKKILEIRDFTLAADPAYEETSANCRELVQVEKPSIEPAKKVSDDATRFRKLAQRKLH